MTVRLAVFDCDGTLSDGQAAICAAMVEAFAEAGLTAPDPHAVRRHPAASDISKRRCQRYLSLKLPQRLHETVLIQRRNIDFLQCLH